MTDDLPQNPGDARPDAGAAAGGTSGDSAASSAPQWTPPGGPGPAYAPTAPPPGAYPTAVLPSVPPQQKKKRRGGLVAGALAGTLIVGGAAGVGGAALYSNGQDDAIGGGSGTTSQVVNAKAPKGTVENVAAKVLPSVVKIDVSGSQESGSGSGIILSSDGVILTNDHVVQVATGGGDQSQGQGQGGGTDPFGGQGTDPFGGEGSNPFGGGQGGSSSQGGSSGNGSIRVDFNNGKSASAHVLGDDPLTDIAVIKVDGVSGLTPATLGKSSKLAVGQSVVAIGSPFGLDSTVTTGIVSALNRPVNVGSDSSGNATVYPAIQTDAAINPGNSGGALTDLNGNVVGINASIRSTSDGSSGEAGSIGLGFAIPIDEVLPVIDQLKGGEKATHARLGISVSDSQGAQSGKTTVTGATVQDLTGGSAAQKAGLKKGDIITKVDDHMITGSDSLVATVRSYRPGDKVKVTWVSGGKTKSADITLDSDAEATTS